MKLTKYMKECIVRRILADVPARDFQAEAEALVLPAALARLPKEVRKIVDNPDLAGFVKTARVGTNFDALHVNIPARDSYLNSSECIDAMGAETWAAFQALCGENRAAKEARATLQQQLEANFSGISTRKQFVERYPEVAKYAPEERDVVANLPATTALIDTLKAAGLPVQS